MISFSGRLAFGLVAMLALLRVAPAADFVPPKFEKPPATIPGSTRYVFKQVNGFDLPLYVFLPPAAAPARRVPMIVFFHGSGWHSGTLTQFVGHAQALARLGIAAAVAEYRVKLDYDATPFDGLSDVKSAIRWVRGHAAGLGVAPRRVGAAGGSAGAHLALCAAEFPDRFDTPGEDLAVSSRPDLLLLFAAVTDLSPSANEPQPNPLFGGREQELSPIAHVSRGLPPMQVFQGTEDAWALPDRTRRFADAVEAQGGTCDFILFQGRGHHFYNHPSYYSCYPFAAPPNHGRDDFDLCLLLVTRFLHDHGFLAERAVVTPQSPPAP